MRTTALLLAGLAMSGCTAAEAFLPKVKFDRLDVRDVTFEDIGADFVFKVTNPNPVEIKLASFSYALDLEEINLFSGDNEEGFALEKNGNSELILPMDLVFAEAWETVQATRGEDMVDFSLEGHFGFDTPLGKTRLPYSEAGDFPAVRTPKISFKKIRLTKLTLLGATLAVDLGVDNEHASTLFFDNFDYALDLGGEDVAGGLLKTFDVEGASEGTVTLPIDINLVTAGAAVVDAILNHKKLDVGLAAAVDVDTPFGIIPLDIDEVGSMLIEDLL